MLLPINRVGDKALHFNLWPRGRKKKKSLSLQNQEPSLTSPKKRQEINMSTTYDSSNGSHQDSKRDYAEEA